MQDIELKGLEQIDRLCKRLESSPKVFEKARWVVERYLKELEG